MKLLMQALSGLQTPRPPVWLMRQAGRYLPEYKATRSTAGGFLDLCYTPDLAVEVTLQPIRRFGFDAAILFSDILVLPHALGRNVWFVEGEGPRLDPLPENTTLGEFDEAAFHAHLAPVYETVRRLRSELPAETALIGFAGAPWTVATYVVAGRGSTGQEAARGWAYRHPESFGALIDHLTTATIAYLRAQCDNGAEVVQIFDSWAASLAPLEFDRWTLEPIRKIAQALRETHPGVKIIGFPRGCGGQYMRFAQQAGVDGVGLDTTVAPEWARDHLQPHVCVQGNLDPLLMTIGGAPMLRAADHIVETLSGGGHIFNLGHGITPDADPRNVEALVRHIRG